MANDKILGLSGSLRSHSYCTAVLKTIQESGLKGAELTIHSLADVPLYNQDDDGDASPAAVKALRDAIATSDGVIMISPEYNHGMSGVLKNALDWASRPYAGSCLLRKPVLTMTTSPAFTGGVRAQMQMNETLLSIPAWPVLRPQTVIGLIHDKIRDDRLVDAATLGFVKNGIAALLQEIAVLRSGVRAAA
jgi:chromate reductase